MVNSLLLWRKILMQWFLPPGIIIIAILVLYFLLILKKKNIATIFMLFLIPFMFLFSSWLGECLFLRPLEDKFIQNEDLLKNSNELVNPIIVVLSGDSINRSLLTEEDNVEVGEITLARLIGAYFLYKEMGFPILVSGGTIPNIDGNTPAANTMKELLVKLGIPEEDVLIEGNSSTTLENAIFTMELIKKYNFQEVILVTSSVHMPRAMLAFKNLDVMIVPAPVNFLYEDMKPGILDILPNRGSWEHNLRALHEWIGLLYYKIIIR